MSKRSLDLLLGGLTLLTPVTLHLTFPVIPVIKAEFGLSDALAQLTFTIVVLTLAFGTLAYGALGDRYGRRPVLLVGLALFLIGSVLSTLAASFAGLLVGRLIQAAGAASGVTLARAIARDVYGADGMVKAIAYLTLAFAVGGLTAPGIGGLLVDNVGWRWLFGLATLAGMAALACTYLMIPETQMATPAGGGTSMLAGLVELMRRPRFFALVFQTGCTTATFMALVTAASVFMNEVLHRPATEFGLYFAMLPTGYITGTLISSRLGSRTSVERMVLTGAGISLAAVLVQSSLLLWGHLTPLVLFLPGAFLTFGQGLSLPYAQSGAMAIIPRLAATAAGVGLFMQNFVGAGVAQIYGILADGTSVPLAWTMLVTAAVGFAAAFAASVLRESGKG
ncbi:MAG TPA: MFS transporter [Hyphomicrobiaceae bacterium]|nr:MFS transporter [Hyphomicrobiaceae bacterium]